MKIKVIDAPLGHKFAEGNLYQVYGFYAGYNQAFVFDDDCEACFLTDLEYEEFENES